MAIFSAQEIVIYQKIINNTRIGEHELNYIFSPIWANISPTIFGKDFYETYQHGFFSGIDYIGKRSDNHIIYEIL